MICKEWQKISVHVFVMANRLASQTYNVIIWHSHLKSQEITSNVTCLTLQVCVARNTLTQVAVDLV